MATCIVSALGDFLEVNQGFCDVLGLSADELVRVNARSLTPAEEVEHEELQIAAAKASSQDTFNIRKRFSTPARGIVTIDSTVSYVRDAEGAVAYVIVQSLDLGLIDERERLRLEADTDPLTGLLNRRALLRRATDLKLQPPPTGDAWPSSTAISTA